MAAVTVHNDFGAQKIKAVSFLLFPQPFAMKWWDQMPWSSFFECWDFKFNQLFHSLLSVFFKRLFSSFAFCHKVGVICISEVIDISPGNLDSSSCFLQGGNIQPWCVPFLIWNQSVAQCPVLTVASWPAYRFLRRQLRWSGIPISFRIFQFIVIHIVKSFGIVNKAEIDVFLELSSFFDGPADVGNLISGFSAFF